MPWREAGNTFSLSVCGPQLLGLCCEQQLIRVLVLFPGDTALSPGSHSQGLGDRNIQDPLAEMGGTQQNYNSHNLAGQAEAGKGRRVRTLRTPRRFSEPTVCSGAFPKGYHTRSLMCSVAGMGPGGWVVLRTPLLSGVLAYVAPQQKAVIV